MDLYTNPPRDAYILGWTRWIKMPLNENESRWAIVVSEEDSRLWITIYTIIIDIIFAAVVRAGLSITLACFKLGNSGSRHTMLVTFYNNKNPFMSLWLMTFWLKKGLFNTVLRGKWKIDWRTVRGSLQLIFIALCLATAHNVTKVFIGTRHLVLANAAPANPEKIFYPSERNRDFIAEGQSINSVFWEWKSVRAPAIYQAIGRTESARQNINDKLNLKFESDSATEDFSFTYSYSITGYELGLLDDSDLLYSVQGNCSVDPVPVNTTTDGVDIYTRNFNPQPYRYNFSTDIASLPFVAAIDPPPDIIENYYNTGNPYEFQLIPRIAHRYSMTPSSPDELWYRTEDNPSWDKEDPYWQYRIARGRPAVRCVQEDKLELHGNSVRYFVNMRALPDIKIPEFLTDVLTLELGVPVVPALSNNIGPLLLASAAYYDMKEKSIRASECSLEKDLARMIRLSYSFSREIIRNLVLVYPDTVDQVSSLQNRARESGSGATLATTPGDYGAFFIESPDVAALDAVLLFTTIGVAVFVWIIIIIWDSFLDRKAILKNSGLRSRLLLRSSGLQAAQLYRLLDESISGAKRWSGRLSAAPYIRDIGQEIGGNEEAFIPGEKNLEQGLGDSNPSTPSPQPEPLTRPPLQRQRTSLYAKPKAVVAEAVYPDREGKGDFYERLIGIPMAFWDRYMPWRGRGSESIGGKYVELDFTREWSEVITIPEDDSRPAPIGRSTSFASWRNVRD